MPFDSSNFTEEMQEYSQEFDPAHVVEALLAFVRRYAPEAGTDEAKARKLISEHIVNPVLAALDTEQTVREASVKGRGDSLEENQEITGTLHLIWELRRLLTCAPSKENVLAGINTQAGE